MNFDTFVTTTNKKYFTPLHSTIGYAGYDIKNNKVRVQSSICFGSLTSTFSSLVTVDYFFLTNHKKPLYDIKTPFKQELGFETEQDIEEARKRFFQWILDPLVSPWRTVLPDVSNEDGFFWNKESLDKYPADVLINFCIATRAWRERPKNILLWYYLVTKRGWEPALAFYMCGWIQQELVTDLYSVQRMDHNHWPVDPKWSKRTIKNFTQGRHKTSKDLPFSRSRSFRPCNKIWGPKYISAWGSFVVEKVVKNTHNTYVIGRAVSLREYIEGIESFKEHFNTPTIRKKRVV